MNSSWQGIYDNLKQCVKKQRHHYSQRSVNQVCGLTSSHVRLWELDHTEGRVLKNWCFLTVVLEKTLESPLDSNDIKAVNLKGNQPWIAIGRADAEAPILWPPDVNNQLIGKDLNAGKDWRPKRRGQQRMRWTWTWANSGRWWGTGCGVCDPWNCKESDTTWWLNNSNNNNNNSNKISREMEVLYTSLYAGNY